ncbi:ABC-type transport system substrate-binding protein [Actinoplanes campanulatus]|uniref:ABC-type transport system substrate-binding protein n=1 Tax=Actinoplanes campanulatus TaxID=113559 RepID=A0A7W5FFT0_9ACTN|nr:ABC transporter substrate-binding protein [Actinoplanes campanulatus]MBB3096685.1 ABC-type transport system substrate-binding protein [Actinoplanes campanulatus]GGN30636.1 hypothetical protein GCM10010109_50430 [Actinoplanes campanulatus]GID37228.1 hypothetical protein Aca09nite_37340 [Actinoplanes campanulatus]
MRRTRPAAVLAAVTLALTAACSPGSSAAPGAGQPVSGGSLTWAVETEPITFNPHQYAQAKAGLLAWNTFEALLTHDDKGGYLPWLATGYETSPDGKTYTFRLRTDVSFTDGTKFDATAVKANVDQFAVEGYNPAVQAVQLRNLDRVEVVDPATVAFHLKQPDVLILLTFARGLNSGSAYSYYFNIAHAPFDDIRVRQAFREAVDVDAVLQGVYRGSATRAWSVIGPTSPFYDRSLEKTYGGDAAEANRLLDEAGWTTRDADGFRTRDGKRLTVRLVQSAPFVRDRRDVLAQAVQAAVKQSAGIDLNVALVDQGTATQALADGAYEVFDNSRADTDAGAALNLLLHSAGAINRTGVKDPELDRLLEEGQAGGDQAARNGTYQRVQRLTVTDQALILPLYAPADQVAASATVGGLGFEPTAGVPGSAYNLWLGR